jgi:hypothetical protein
VLWQKVSAETSLSRANYAVRGRVMARVGMCEIETDVLMDKVSTVVRKLMGGVCP